MVGWIILAVLIGLITLIMLIPVGADFRYEEDGIVRLSAKIAGLKLQLLPKKRRKTKPQKPETEKEPEPEQEKPNTEGKQKKKLSIALNAEEILELLKTVLRGFGSFGRKFKVERFRLHWIATGSDPYVTARIFSFVNAGLSQLAPICEERFHCRDSSVWTDLDFAREDMLFEFGITMTIRIGQIVASGIRIAFGALLIILRSKRRVKRETKEEAAALEKWLEEHPEDAARLQAQQAQEAENARNAQEAQEAEATDHPETRTEEPAAAQRTNMAD